MSTASFGSPIPPIWRLIVGYRIYRKEKGEANDSFQFLAQVGTQNLVYYVRGLKKDYDLCLSSDRGGRIGPGRRSLRNRRLKGRLVKKTALFLACLFAGTGAAAAQTWEAGFTGGYRTIKDSDL